MEPLPGASTMAPRCLPLLLLLLAILLLPATANTDSQDVSALNVMYTSMNSPHVLSGWSSGGGDPCGDDWKGITCSGSSVTEIKLSGLGLTGSMGYQLSNLKSVTDFDLSKNKLSSDIPYQLPPNAVNINLRGNSFTGTVPYSISLMTDLKYLNLGNNKLSGQLTDMFANLKKLEQMDLSFNHFTGNLPKSFTSLSNLDTLHLENNQFSGPIDVLANIPLEDLNIENNKFTGWVPDKLRDIQNIQIGGNSWSSGRAPPYYSPANSVSSGGLKQSTINGVAIAGGVVAVLLIFVILLALMKRKSPSTSHAHYIDDQLSQNRSFTPLVSQELKPEDFSSSIDMKGLQRSSSVALKPPPSEKSFNENEFANTLPSRRSTEPIAASAYSLLDLQAATGSFDSSRLLGNGSIGSVYKAKYADGKVLAVKKIDSTDMHDFTEIVSEITRLHHPNISELVGFCSEPGYQLLVYEFQRNGSLHEFLHVSDEYSKPLTWDTRVRIALGTARAVEYLHEVCSPSIMHKNIKSANILLDAELNPHLSDCGLACFYQDTIENLGPGCNAPECTKSSSYTLKSDVYSFGVVMLELLTGRTAYDSSRPRAEQFLVRWSTPQLHDIDALGQMVDPALRGLYPPKSLSRFADVIALCVQPEPEFRPPMSEVVQALVRCVQRTSINKRLGGDLSNSRRSDDSDYGYY